MISFANINKQYGKQLLFVDASFQLNPGEEVGLVGPNGAGCPTHRVRCDEWDAASVPILQPIPRLFHHKSPVPASQTSSPPSATIITDLWQGRSAPVSRDGYPGPPKSDPKTFFDN